MIFKLPPTLGTSSESWTYLYTSCSDDCQTTRTVESSLPFKLNCSGGSGGSDEDNSVELVTTDTIIKLLQKPCFVSVVNGISSAKFKNQIVQLFNETYVGNGHVANLKFIENTNLFNSDDQRDHSRISVYTSFNAYIFSWYSKAFETNPYFNEPYYVGFNIKVTN